MSHRDNMLRNYNFAVQIDGMDELHFSEVTGLSVEVQAIRFRSGTDLGTGAKVLPGRISYEPVTLERGLARDLALWEWLSTIEGGQTDMRNVTISVLDEEHEPAIAFRLTSAWPSRLQLGRLDGLGNGVAIEKLTLTYERLSVENL